MTGRGIDQILPYPGDPLLHEPCLRDARGYVELAEKVNGPIRKPADFSYVWGDVLTELEASSPDARIINLETSVTASDDYWKGKGINYRMNPKNAPCLWMAKIDVSCLANNHILDWGRRGLLETINTLKKAGIKTAGAGKDRDEAQRPAIKELREGRRALVFAFAHQSSGVPPDWWASRRKPGVSALPDLSEKTAESIGKSVRGEKRSGDVAVASLHWGPNWGYEIPDEQRRFAHALIDLAAVDVVHGHSSHHAKGIEVYSDKLILYSCGDLLNDYEGITGYEEFRGNLGLLYFPVLEPEAGRLLALSMVVMTVKRFRLERTEKDDIRWIAGILNREGKRFGTSVSIGDDRSLALRWK